MKKTSILSELTNLANQELRTNLVESRSQHILSSVIYLIEDIEKNFSPEESEDLKKKLLNSIKSKDPGKFSKALTRIKNGKYETK
jgi:hypothetical protein